MDHVFAKLKRLTKNPFFKLLSNHTLFENISIDPTNCIPYSTDHNLDEDAWFKVENFTQKPFCIDLLKGDFNSKNYDNLKKSQFINIAYILSIQNTDFYFQKINQTSFIRKKIIHFGEIAEVEKTSSLLIINPQPDAIFLKEADTLIFRNLASISGIFKGIDSLYREATQQETEDFLCNDFIDLGDNYDADKVSKPNRKRIALATDSLLKLNKQERLLIIDYINHYCDKKLAFDGKIQKFKISTDDQLKILLYGIEQRFYTTQFGSEKRLANSVQAVG